MIPKTMLVDEIASFDIPAAELSSYPMVSKKLRDIGKERMYPKLCEDSDGHGHSSCFGLAAQMGTGYPELDKLIREPKNLRFTFHLRRVLMPEDYEKDSWQLNESEKLSSVDELRERGNSFFKEGDLDAAIRAYQEALRRLDTLVISEKPGEPEWKQLDDGKIPLYLNLAQCQLKSGMFYEAIQSCTEALDRDPENEKGLFRRAKALMGVWSLDEARKDLEELRRSHPQTEGLVGKQLGILERLEKDKEKGEKSFCQGIFRE